MADEEKVKIKINNLRIACCPQRPLPMKVETTLPLQKEARSKSEIQSLFLPIEFTTLSKFILKKTDEKNKPYF